MDIGGIDQYLDDSDIKGRLSAAMEKIRIRQAEIAVAHIEVKVKREIADINQEKAESRNRRRETR